MTEGSHAILIAVSIMVASNSLFLSLNGLFMLIAPEVWYEFVPGVTDTGFFNQHFIRDIGIIQLFLGLAFGIGMFRPERRIGRWAAATLWLSAHAVSTCGKLPSASVPPRSSFAISPPSAWPGHGTELRQGRRKVVITARRAEPLEEAAADHPNMVGLVAAAAAPDDAVRIIAKAIDTWGHLDVLVNNAGAGAILRLADATADRIMKIFAVNVPTEACSPRQRAGGYRLYSVIATAVPSWTSRVCGSIGVRPLRSSR
jgi:hypothetical protein